MPEEYWWCERHFFLPTWASDAFLSKVTSDKHLYETLKHSMSLDHRTPACPFNIKLERQERQAARNARSRSLSAFVHQQQAGIRAAAALQPIVEADDRDVPVLYRLRGSESWVGANVLSNSQLTEWHLSANSTTWRQLREWHDLTDTRPDLS